MNPLSGIAGLLGTSPLGGGFATGPWSQQQALRGDALASWQRQQQRDMRNAYGRQALLSTPRWTVPQDTPKPHPPVAPLAIPDRPKDHISSLGWTY